VLTHLHIRNLAVVDEVEAEMTAGLTVLTGETGAGKSIMIDALALVLGERADSDAVRTGSQRAEVTATFALSPASAALGWLQANDLDDSGAGECVLRRIVTAEGRSRGYINGNPAPVGKLRELGSMLVDICGQQAHQSLNKADTQRTILDQHGNLLARVEKYRTTYQTWRELQERATQLEASRTDQAHRIDLLRFQVQELQALDAQPGELDELNHAHRLAANASRVREDGNSALQMLYENEQASAYDLISRARSQLEELAELDPGLQNLSALLNEAEIQVTEVADSLRQYLDKEQPDAGNLAELEQRLGAMQDMARKHRIAPGELPALAEQLTDELNTLENADESLEQLQQQADACLTDLQALAKKLTAARRKSAKSLAKAVTENMQQLGMADGEFDVVLEPLETPGALGAERIEFRVAINPGMRPGALARVASGGELSRVSLAIQVAASAQANTGTLIFDEVDSGVGGGTAEIVGDKLRGLADTYQVMCVTHLPQVASKGHRHFRVSKLSDGQITRTRVTELDENERVDELARMLGGVEITQRTLDHAAEMLTAGNG